MGKRAPSRRTTDSNTYRFFVDPAVIHGDVVELTDRGLVHQLGSVLRLQPEQCITLLDNAGRAYTVLLDQIDKHVVRGTVVEQAAAGGEPQLELTLYMALVRSERFEWVLQKGTELGIRSFVPLLCERSLLSGADAITPAKLERWQRIIREAAEQARRGRLPSLQPPQAFGPVCTSLHEPEQAVLLWEKSGVESLRSRLTRGPQLSTIFSGPEGGWSDDEHNLAVNAGITLVSLGPRTLRAETAPLVAATAVLYTAGDLD
ncbi:MAG: 16S rRNA (uracil(1498)-N(3))-methyltransferase [Herpetosiphonaceae bacterium]|nr:16S rRNA (uracil(1498)-N(3))-methyltransferase [Herpetosiphonaceae bacterium]